MLLVSDESLQEGSDLNNMSMTEWRVKELHTTSYGDVAIISVI